MRRLIAASAVLLLFTACKKPRRVSAGGGQAEEVTLRSVVATADPRTAMQLVRGFHEVEQNAWRWSMGRFAVTLRPPAGAALKGANLALEFSIADPIIERLKTIKVSANVEGVPIPEETYTKPGNYTYRREVPAAALKSDSVQVEFAVDPYIKAGEVETRELALIVASIGLVAK